MQEGKETVERREISREELLENVRIHEEETREKRKLAGLCRYMYCIFVVLLFLYLRLYNTKFEYDYDYDFDDWVLRIKYSTAWVVRLPAEYEGTQVLKACVSDWETYRYPHVLVVEVEKGISYIVCKKVFLLRIPKYIFTGLHFSEQPNVEIR